MNTKRAREGARWVYLALMFWALLHPTSFERVVRRVAKRVTRYRLERLTSKWPPRGGWTDPAGGRAAYTGEVPAPDAFVHGRLLAGPDPSTPCCEATDREGVRCVLYAGHDEGPRPTKHKGGPFPGAAEF